MIPSATSPVGVMFRKATLELQIQLSTFSRQFACPSFHSSSDSLPARRTDEGAQLSPEPSEGNTQREQGGEEEERGRVFGEDLGEGESLHGEGKKKSTDLDSCLESSKEKGKESKKIKKVTSKGFLLDGHRGVGKVKRGYAVSRRKGETRIG